MDLKRVDVQEAKRLLDEEGYTLIDVRSVPEYGESHAAGAYNVPFLNKTAQGMIPNELFGPVVQAHFPSSDSKLLLMSGMGGRSSRATQELMARGYTQVVDIKGGFGGEHADDGSVTHAGWSPSGLPTEDGQPSGRRFEDLAPEKADAVEEAAAEAAAVEAMTPEDGEGMNRFASRSRKVNCVKLGRELPGLKRRPYPGPLGERVFAQISAAAWNDWVEHSKMIINEYRINSADPNSIKLLMEQCEAFFFGEADLTRPEGYVPEA